MKFLRTHSLVASLCATLCFTAFAPAEVKPAALFSDHMVLQSGMAAPIWGTADPRYWASLDPKRPVKQVGLILDLGKFVHPFITPDDPDAVESAIRAHADLGPTSSGTSPVV